MVALGVEPFEKRWIVDFTGFRFVAAGVACDLNMRDAGPVFVPSAHHITGDALGVVGIELQGKVRGVERVEDARRLIEVVEEIAGDVDGVDRFDRQRGLACLLGGPAQVF